ncbi:MAG: ribbon-helix-helix protein, CopG family [Planctomycetaceae bacterium]|nr:ribbon-helix-helix protein, CopG family [Planctomycetaceae bacterium]
MATINVDDQTARSLEARAAALGISVGEYLRRMLDTAGPLVRKVPAAELEELLDRELTEAPLLPADFSRSDIYAQHD